MVDALKSMLVTVGLLSNVFQVSHGQEALAPASGEVRISRSTGKIAKGTEWETDYFGIDSGRSGATVLVVGGMHGNEPAGSRAADQIRHWPIVRGKMFVVPRANVLALAANTRLTPGEPEVAGNLNRNFPQAEQGESLKVAPRGELAAALWAFAMKAQPDWILDLHEGYEFHRSHQPPKGKKKSVGSSIIYRGGETLDPVVEKMIVAADATVTDPEKRFSRLRNGPVETGYARACIRVIGAEGLILETTFKDQPMSLRTRQHRAMVNELLNHIGLVDRDCRNFLVAKGGEKLQVAILDGKGVGPSSLDLGKVIESAPDMDLIHVGPAEMRIDVLEQFDVVVFPGGSGSKQAGAIGKNGRHAVREFVKNGGGVLGVCAGAYLCSAQYEWSLDLIDSSVFTGSAEIPGKGRKQLWYRGPRTGIDIELTSEGKRLYAEKGIASRFVVQYANGPIISPKELGDLEDYKVLAWFRSETGLWQPQEGTMINTPAIASGSFGKGRVISMSPHPELTPTLHPIIAQSIRWVANQAD